MPLTDSRQTFPEQCSRSKLTIEGRTALAVNGLGYSEERGTLYHVVSWLERIGPLKRPVDLSLIFC